MLCEIAFSAVLIHQISVSTFKATAKEANEIGVANPGKAFKLSSERIGAIDFVEVFDGDYLTAGQNPFEHLSCTTSPQALSLIAVVYGTLYLCLGEPIHPRPRCYLLRRHCFPRLLPSHASHRYCCEGHDTHQQQHNH